MATPDSLVRRVLGRVVWNRPLAGDTGLLRLRAPELASARPGHFVQVSCGAELLLPRPFSIMDADVGAGTVDIFYKVVGQGTRVMAGWGPGATAFLLGPLGRPFEGISPPAEAVVVAGGVGLAPLDFLARRLAVGGVAVTLLWGIEGELPLPTVRVADGALALDHLQRLSISSRLASLAEKSGFFQGYVTALASQYLEGLSRQALDQTRLYVCGPPPMMVAAAAVARHFDLGGQVSLEERMACGFGGCAGCVAPMRGDQGDWNYRRVCVDGPVFSLAEVDWPRYARAHRD